MNNQFKVLLICSALIAGCSGEEKEADAWGTFEATIISVAPVTSGRILTMNAREGEIVSGGQTAALTDTTGLSIHLREAIAGQDILNARLRSIDSEREVLRQQLNNLEREIARVENLVEGNAATTKQLDDLKGQAGVTEKQISAILTGRESVRAEQKVLDIKMENLRRELSDCRIVFPSDGTILSRLAEPGEVVTPGKPLYRLADMSKMELKVYISGNQLTSVVPGETCIVRIDDPETNYREFKGIIARVADRAEFTPKIIQTKEERVSLVYAVTIFVKNDNSIKIGMPGEAIFTSTERE
jgi:HlyD family secretion protein